MASFECRLHVIYPNPGKKRKETLAGRRGSNAAENIALKGIRRKSLPIKLAYSVDYDQSTFLKWSVARFIWPSVTIWTVSTFMPLGK
jgi:hypothetical protein